MSKKLKQIALCAIVMFSLTASPPLVSASDCAVGDSQLTDFTVLSPIQQMEVQRVEQDFNTVLRYITIDGERVFFDYNQASHDNVSPSVLRMGVDLEELSIGFSEGKMTSQELTRGYLNQVYGNYCGPWHSGNNFTLPPVDLLDWACMEHDKCYNWGLTLKKNCQCNHRLVVLLKTNRRWMTGVALEKSRLIQWYFETFGLTLC